MKAVFHFIKNWTLPLAMITGTLFHGFFTELSVLIPSMIFIMLLLTFSKLKARKVRITSFQLWLILFQVVVSIVLFLVLRPFNSILAESALICVLAPTATSAVVVTGMLGGSVAALTTYTLACNLVVAIVAPVLFSLIGQHAEMSFWHSFSLISLKVMPMLILPLVVAFFIQRFLPSVNRKITSLHGMAFYIWALALIIVTARTVNFLLEQDNLDKTLALEITVLSMALCALQFFVGKRVGRRYKKTIAGGQALGQKNTILAIWMAQSFLNPIASLGPAAYVLWQNSFNSWQLYRRRKAVQLRKAD